MVEIFVVTVGEACPAEEIAQSVAVAGVLCCCECGGRAYDGGDRCDAVDVIWQWDMLVHDCVNVLLGYLLC